MLNFDFHKMMSGDALPSIRDLIQDPNPNPSNPNPNSNPSKRKRSLPGTPDPDAEVIALSPKSLMAKNRFICEICSKGFQRDQNLQLHRRGHNLPWKLKQRNSNEVVRKKVYICPEKTCVHHDPSRALGDLTGVKKHYSRKHGEKKWKCEKCSKKYAVHSDLKAHSRICGTREYKCDCGTIFSRKDSFITHRAFCDALAEESSRFRPPIPSANLSFRNEMFNNGGNPQFLGFSRPEIGGIESGNQVNFDLQKTRLPLWLDSANPHLNQIGNPIQMAAQNQWLNPGRDESFPNGNVNASPSAMPRIVLKDEEEEEENLNKGNFSEGVINSSIYYSEAMNHHQHGMISPAPLSATALLQKAAEIGSTRSGNYNTSFGLMSSSYSSFTSFNQTRNDAVEKAESNFNGFMASTSASTLTSNNGDHNLLIDDTNSSSALMNARISEGENGLTRDFLGVGANENRHFLQDFAAELEMRHYMSRTG